MLKEDTLLVSYCAPSGVDSGILIVGRKNPKQTVDILNAFQGKEALDLYEKLLTKKEIK